jgi:hypothetical protein
MLPKVFDESFYIAEGFSVSDLKGNLNRLFFSHFFRIFSLGGHILF